ncbi:putative ribonuclease H-like domain-containing protein [Tanacetum coccineum]
MILVCYGKKGPQNLKLVVSDDNSSEHSTCQSNDSGGSCGNTSEHSFETESESLSEPNEMFKSRLEVTNEKDVSAPKSKEVEPSCVSHIKTPRQPLTDKETHTVNRKNWNDMMEKELGEDYSFTKKKCFVCGSLNHLIKDCDYYEKKMAKPVWTNANRINHTNQFVPRSVQLNAGRPKFNTVRPNINTGRTNINSGRPKVNAVSPKVNTVRSKQPVTHKTSNSMSPKRPQMNQINQRRDFSKSYSSVRRPFEKSTAQMAHSNAVMGSWGSAVKTSASYNWRNSRPNFNYNSGPTFIRTEHPLKNMVDRGIFDSGCSGHMTGNKDQLEDFEEFNGGSVTFGGSKGYISGKGRIRVGNLDFDSVSFVKELGHFNLFSISQICDKQHKVLFTETECLVVSSDFKMPDENQILLKVPRHHNMYSFDMKTPSPAKCAGKFDGKSDEGFLVDKPNVKGVGYRWMFDIDYLSDSMNYIPVSLENQANPHAAVRIPEEKDESRTSSTNSKKEVSSTDSLEDNPKIQAFRRKLDDVALKHLGTVPENNTTSTPSVNTGSHTVNTGRLEHDDSLMPELEIFHKPETGIFDEASYDEEGVITDFNSLPTEIEVSPTPTLRIHSIHPKSQILGDPKSAVQTRSKVQNKSGAHALLNCEAFSMMTLVQAMARRSVPVHAYNKYGFPCRFYLCGMKEIKQDLVAMGYSHGRSAFLYGTMDEEVYVSQPPDFVDPAYPNKVYKVVKALYGPAPAPSSWFVLLFNFPSEAWIQRGTIDKTLFHSKEQKGYHVVVQSANNAMDTKMPLTKDEEAFDVDVHLYRSMIGSLMYLTAFRPDIMYAVCVCSHFQVTPKISHLNAVKRIFKYLKGKPNLGLWYPRESPFDLEAFSDSDYGGSNLDRKSTTGGYQFLGQRLISWQCKKQTIVATSTTEAEYVAAANCCGQVLWVQNQLLNYGFNFMNTKIQIDNESTICIVKNPVYHSKTKHIEIRHHFIRDCYEKKLISVEKIHTDLNVADLLTKPFDGPRFNYLVVSIGQ